jgi:hypothetical protein
MTKIIAFAGRKQSGKSTACEYISNIISTRPYNTFTNKIYSFADPLKQDICINILGLSHDQCYGSDDDKNSLTHLTWNDKQLTARDVMQIVGTEMFRTMYPNVWVNALINKIKNDNIEVALISDCRFPNEVDIVHKNHGYVIRLTRNLFNVDHPSEKALDKEYYDWSNFDWVIDNQNLNIDDKNKAISDYLYYSRALYYSNTKNI